MSEREGRSYHCTQCDYLHSTASDKPHETWHIAQKVITWAETFLKGSSELHTVYLFNLVAKELGTLPGKRLTDNNLISFHQYNSSYMEINGKKSDINGMLVDRQTDECISSIKKNNLFSLISKEDKHRITKITNTYF